jgi:hypothetical protein
MEELLLELLLLGEELDIVHDEHVVFPVFLLEDAHFLVLESVHAVLAELLEVM